MILIVKGNTSYILWLECSSFEPFPLVLTEPLGLVLKLPVLLIYILEYSLLLIIQCCWQLIEAIKMSGLAEL